MVGGGARDPHGLEPGEPHIGLVARHPREPAIDHHPHAFDGQRGLCDRGREHDLAPPGRRRRDRPVLHVGVERAVKRHDVDRGITDALAQERLAAADLGGAGKKDQERSGIGPQRASDGAGDLRFDRGARVAAEIAGLDREGAAGALDQRRIAEELADARAVERRRHHQELEVGAQALLHVVRQRQAEVAVERALVELVEQNGGDAGERGIVEHKAREHALGHHFDARRGRDFGAEAHAVAHAGADGFAQRRRHARGRRPRRKPTRLEHQELFSLRPRLGREHERNPRGLAGAGRGDQDRGVCRAQSARQLRQRRIDGKRFSDGVHRGHFACALRFGEGARRDVHSGLESVAKSPFKC